MSKEIQVFVYLSQEVRVLEIEDAVWFIASDVEKVLELKNIRQNVADLDDDEKLLYPIHTGGQIRNVQIISEPGFYKVIGHSRTEPAKAFDRWVRHEVLPAIRKTGSYSIHGDINFDGYEEISYHDVEKDPELLRQVIQLFEDLGLTLKNKRTRLVEVERDDFPGHTFTRGKCVPMKVKLYIKQLGDKVQLGIATVGKEHIIQKVFWGQDRAI